NRRTALAQNRNLEREVGAAHAGPLDRLHARDACAKFDNARLQACDFGFVSPDRPFAHHESVAAATSESYQQARTDEIETCATLNARKNASSFFNEASTVRAGEFVKDKDSLPGRCVVRVTAGTHALRCHGRSCHRKSRSTRFAARN